MTNANQTHNTSACCVCQCFGKGWCKGGGVTSDFHMVSKKFPFCCLDFKLQTFAQKHFLSFDFKMDSKQ